MENNLAIALAYYKAMSQKDLSALGQFLASDVHLIGPLAELSGKDAVLKSVQHLASLFQKLTVRAHFASGDQVMLAYDIEFPAPIGVSRAAVLLTFKNDLISRYELFFDARPFVKP